MTAQTPSLPSVRKVLPAQTQSPRYYAFDCVRAMAMLLGVFYHWQFVRGSFGMATGPKASVDHWLHSFRMALFFLISGFFANMMLGKYGLMKYLRRRWWRIGAPLLVAMVAFAGFRFAQSYFTWAAPPGMNFGPARGGFGTGGGFGPGGFGGFAPGGGTAPAMPGPGGFPAVQPQTPAIPAPRTTPSPAAPAPRTPAAPAPPAFTLGPTHPWADWLFAKLHLQATRAPDIVVRVTASNFELQHLWFLWYLLLFCTVAPLITRPMAFLFVRGEVPLTDRIGRFLLRFDIAPLLLALITLPALLHARGMDWTLTNPAGFSGVFPDFLAQYFVDLPFYFLYFLFGWWFFRLRASLDSVARPWLFNLSLGITAFAVSQALYDNFNPAPAFGGFGFPVPAVHPAAPAAIRLLAFALYAVGSAYSGFGLLGLFQKYLDRPTRFGRYFTDTMLWVYLVQLAIIPYLANWVDYNNTSWWEATLGGVIAVTAIALVLFELLVRHTPLIYIFGPASITKKFA
jgi:branched-subunit amino acid transport protein